MTEYNIIKESGSDGQEAIIIKGEWSPEIIALLKKAPPEELSLLGINWPDFTGLSPIAKYIIKLKLISITASSKGLENFTNIKYLLLDEPISPVFDLTCFKKLEIASLSWNKKFSSDFFKIPSLTKLELRHFDENDCRKIGVSSSIEDLTIWQSRIRTLDGLEQLNSLKKLKISHLRVLKDISAIMQLVSLESIHIESCAKILSLSPIKSLIGLRYLYIDKVKVGFNDLDWVANLPNLNYVLNEAEVKDINWDIICENKSIKEFATRTHDGYTITDDQLISIASNAGRIIKVIERFPPKRKPMISIEFEL